MEKTIILGIDPGFDRMGICVLEKQANKETLLYSACILTDKKGIFESRLQEIGKGLQEVMTKYKPSELAMEKLFFTKNQRTGIQVAEARGVVLYLASTFGLSVFEYSPPQVKLAIAGHGKATKDDISYMVPKILGHALEKNLLDDELDAIAIALTHSASRKMVAWK
jgi:crossover junction endodeoxyribonuclease RuvC